MTPRRFQGATFHLRYKRLQRRCASRRGTISPRCRFNMPQEREFNMATRIRDLRPMSGSQFLTDSFQRGLAHWNRERLEPGFPSDDWQRTFDRDLRMQRLEGAFLEELRAEVADEAARAPTDVEGFIAWFENLKEAGPGQG